ncbi:MAG TPA: DNA-3-methyladenine glycosylase I [Bacteroidales bacterium]|nr:DNA-3-methyladenine glycosylase I [Bacteroidales bacterium]
MELNRCDWCLGNDLYIAYHDEEWGVPVHDDKVHFEFLTLESAQAGLSWLTILKKRENYRKAFDGFNAEKVASYDAAKIDDLLTNPGIIRNRLKVESAVSNARKFLEIQEEYGSFDAFIWSFTNGKIIQNRWKTLADVPVNTPLSDKVSKELKKRGFKFVGSTIMYAHLQSIGVINDHLTTCFRRHEVSML